MPRHKLRQNAPGSKVKHIAPSKAGAVKVAPQKPNGKIGIWLPSTEIAVSDKAAIKRAKKQAKRKFSVHGTCCTLEYVRLVKMDWFRRRLTKIRKTVRDSMQNTNQRRESQTTANKLKPALMVVERWIMRYQLKLQELLDQHPETRSSDFDPIFPQTLPHGFSTGNGFEDPEFVEDLVRCGDSHSEATQVSKLASALACSIAAQIRAIASELGMKGRESTHKGAKTSVPIPNRETVKVVHHRHTLDVCFVPTKLPKSWGQMGARRELLKLNPAHYSKLLQCYCAWSNIDKTGTVDERLSPKQKDEFHRRLYCLLARYQAIQGHGFQAAVVEHAFQVLQNDLSVELECFASPLNSTFALHCSAFEDTDSCFGSIGSFFNFTPKFGSFEVNPPFEVNVLRKALDHMHSLLEGAAGPLSFVFVGPVWEEADFYAAVVNSRFLKQKVVVNKQDHGFCDGASHQRRDRYRSSPYDTLVAFLQNGKGAKKFPVDKQVVGRVVEAFHHGKPTPAMEARQAAEGRGHSDTARGVYKGPKRKATGTGVVARKKRERKAKLRARKKQLKKT